ncbi:SARP family transcriptional regulator [Pseudaestuariivita rosea]|uniref:SARP family transcriptional regulator n=1 Tax=Pseudaestuariivita rosea TaxID=2763263 RepID=UPI001F414D9C|nr:SARP family transcriptional regulator [Pseudaestuariivita rosea]
MEPVITKALKHIWNEAEPAMKMFLFGPFTVLDANGDDITPKSKKSRAILAMLAVAPRGSRTRVWLRHKLWSDSGEDQASASLRQALLDIRRAFGDIADDVVQADKNTVSLNMDAIDVDALALLDPNRQADEDGQTSFSPTEHFLEGLEVKDPEFDDWLISERQIWQRRVEDADFQHSLDPKSERTGALPIQPVGQNEPRPSMSAQRDWLIALLPPQVFGEGLAVEQVQADLHRMLSKSLMEVGDLKIVDLATASAPTTRAPWIQSVPTTAGLALQMRFYAGPSTFRAALMFQDPHDGSLIWSSERSIYRQDARRAGSGFAHDLISRGVDEVIQHFLHRDGAEMAEEDARLAAAIAYMFRLSREDLDRSERILQWHLKFNNSAQAHAWMAFLMTFRVGQRFSFEDAEVIEKAQTHARNALELDRNNALVSTLVAHVHSYLFGEYDFAAGLFESALKHNPTIALAWDLYAMLHAYAGQPKRASLMAQWACHLGGQSSLSYYYQTTRAITANFAGEHQTAIEAGEMALSERPYFNSLLRVLVSSNAHLGHMDRAKMYLDKLLSVEPTFSIHALREAGYPGLETNGGRHFVQGLLKAGVAER